MLARASFLLHCAHTVHEANRCQPSVIRSSYNKVSPCRGNWSHWLKQQLPNRERAGGHPGRHQSVAASHHKGARIIVQAGKLFHHWAEVSKGCA